MKRPSDSLAICLEDVPEATREWNPERDPQATQQTKERVSGLMEKLKKKGQGGTGIIRGPEV